MVISIPSFGLNTTGGDRVIVSLANGLAERGHTVYVVNLGADPIPYRVSPKVRITRVPFDEDKKDFLNFVVKGMTELANHLPDSDVYLANWVFTVFSCVAKRGKGKTVFLSQADEMYAFKDRSLSVLNGLSYGAYLLRAPVIVPSDSLRKIVKKRFGSEALIIPPCVDTSVFKPGAPHRSAVLKLLFVGDIESENKGLAILLSACEKIKNIRFELHVATQRNITPNDIAPRAKFPVVIHKPENDEALARVYRSSDIFFHLSRKEGFGLTLLEAMACGCVSIVTDSGGVNDFAVSKGNCIFVKRDGNSVARAIRSVYADLRRLRKTLGKNAVLTAARYTEKEMTDRFEDFFFEISSKKHGKKENRNIRRS